MGKEIFTGTEILILETALASWKAYQLSKWLVRENGEDPLEDNGVMNHHCEFTGILKAFAAIRHCHYLDSYETFMEWKREIGE